MDKLLVFQNKKIPNKLFGIKMIQKNFQLHIFIIQGGKINSNFSHKLHFREHGTGCINSMCIPSTCFDMFQNLLLFILQNLLFLCTCICVLSIELDWMRCVDRFLV
eukprot:529336_1